MKTIKNYFSSFILIASVFAFHTTAQAWIFGTSKTKDGSPKQYCVSPGWFNSNPYKCLPYDKAEALGFDYSRVYGGASGAETNQYVQAQADIDRGTVQYDQLNKKLLRQTRELGAIKQRLANEPLTEDERTRLKQRETEIDQDLSVLRPQILKAQQALSVYEQNPNVTGGALRLEIARKGLLAQVNELDNKLATLEDLARNTEQELNNTILEAFIVSKIDRLASNLCQANGMCPDSAAVKKFLIEKVASEKLRSNFKSTTPASAPVVAPAPAPAKQ